MDDDLLDRVVAVEREVRQNIAQEEARARAWLEGAKREAEEKVTAVDRTLRDERDNAINRSKARIEVKAEDILQSARQDAERLRCLDEEYLKGLIRLHLGRVVPGECNDRKDVKS